MYLSQKAQCFYWILTSFFIEKSSAYFRLDYFELMTSRSCFKLILVFGISSVLILAISMTMFQWRPNTITSILPEWMLTNRSDIRLTCLLQAHQVFNSLNASWFLTFGTALFYHRDKNFDSDDIDSGMFYDEFLPLADRIESTFYSFGFSLSSRYGSTEDGREWTFICPKSSTRFDIFIFYPPLKTDQNSSSFVWWCASYNGACNSKKYKKCRWKFSSFELEQITITNRSFSIIPKSFLLEQYGNDWKIRKPYDYFDSLNFLPNLIRE